MPSSSGSTCDRAAATPTPATWSFRPAPASGRSRSAHWRPPGSPRSRVPLDRASPCSQRAASCARPASRSRPGQIYESNRAMIAAVLARANADVELLPVVADDARLTATPSPTASTPTCSSRREGVSMGEHDLVRSTAAESRREEIFWGVAVKPGKPLSFGVRDRTLDLRAAWESRVLARRRARVRHHRASRPPGRNQPRPRYVSGRDRDGVSAEPAPRRVRPRGPRRRTTVVPCVSSRSRDRSRT